MIKKEYYIVGSGGFAKEVYFLAEENLDESHFFKGFIDYKPNQPSLFIRGSAEQIIDEDYFLQNIKSCPSIILFMGIGDPKLISVLAVKFEMYNFPNLFHKNFVGDRRSIEIGTGNIVTAGCIFTVDLKIGSFNIFNLHTTIGHNCVVGNCNVFNPGTNVSGGVTIGNKNLFGTNCAILQIISIGNENIIGASSLLTKSIESNHVMVGVPAKKLEK